MNILSPSTELKVDINSTTFQPKNQDLKQNCLDYLTYRKIRTDNTDLSFDYWINKNPKLSKNQYPCLIATYENGAKNYIAIDKELGKRFIGGFKGYIWKHSSFSLNEPLFIVESVLCALSLIQSGFNAVATGTANNLPTEFYNTLPKNIEIILAYDNDTVGHKSINRDYKYLKDNGFCNIKTALSPIKDWNDLLTNNLFLNNETIKESLEAGNNMIMKINNEVDNEAVNWEEPENIFEQNKLSPVIKYTQNLMPDIFAEAIEDISDRMQVPAEYIAIAYLIAGASILSYKINIIPKEFDDSWVVCCNLWGGIVGKPSTLKTPSLNEALKVFEYLKFEEEDLYNEIKLDYDTSIRTLAMEEKITEDKIKTILKEASKKTKEIFNINNTPQDQPRELYRQLNLKKDSIKKPILRKYVVNDCSIQKLQEYQRDSAGHGILKVRDELTGFFKKLDSAGFESDKAYYLESWAGDTKYTNGTIGRGDTDVPNNTISLIGGIQPTLLKRFLSNTVNATEDDGFFQRLQLLVYPDEKKWHRVDRIKNNNAIENVYRIFKELNKIDTEKCRFFPIQKKHEKELDRWALKFDIEAQKTFNDWWENWEEYLRENALPDYLVSHFVKYRKLIPSLALIIYLLSGKRNCCIDNQSLLMAINWCELLKSHAVRIYGMQSSLAENTAELIADRIIKKELPESFSIRELYLKHWAGINIETAELGLKVLEEAKWGVLENLSQGNKPSLFFKVNPKTEKNRKVLKSIGTIGTIGTIEKNTHLNKGTIGTIEAFKIPIEPIDTSLFKEIPKFNKINNDNVLDTFQEIKTIKSDDVVHDDETTVFDENDINSLTDEELAREVNGE